MVCDVKSAVVTFSNHRNIPKPPEHSETTRTFRNCQNIPKPPGCSETARTFRNRLHVASVKVETLTDATMTSLVRAREQQRLPNRLSITSLFAFRRGRKISTNSPLVLTAHMPLRLAFVIRQGIVPWCYLFLLTRQGCIIKCAAADRGTPPCAGRAKVQGPARGEQGGKASRDRRKAGQHSENDCDDRNDEEN